MLEEWKGKVARKLTLLESSKAQIIQEKAAATSLEKQQQDIVTATTLAQQVAATIQLKAHQRIAKIVSHALIAVFEEDAYTFHILFERKRGTTEARMVFRRDGTDLDPLTASEGGAIDVASFSLRVAALVLSASPKRKFLCLDEPFRHVSVEYRPRVKGLLLALAKDMGLQCLMVTHMRDLQTGTVVTLPQGS